MQFLSFFFVYIHVYNAKCGKIVNFLFVVFFLFTNFTFNISQTTHLEADLRRKIKYSARKCRNFAIVSQFVYENNCYYNPKTDNR